MELLYTHGEARRSSMFFDLPRTYFTYGMSSIPCPKASTSLAVREHDVVVYVYLADPCVRKHRTSKGKHLPSQTAAPTEYSPAVNSR